MIASNSGGEQNSKSEYRNPKQACRPPDELARQNIDKLLTDCGWNVQKRAEINLSASRGIAITEGLLKGRDEATRCQENYEVANGT